MRRALLAGLALAAVPAFATAQSGPVLAAVADPGVKLRAGPSDQFPETSTPPKGFKLLVHQDEPNGWVAVTDVPGQVHSVSWVQTQFVDFDKTRPLPQLVAVDEGGTTLRAGQMGLAQPLHIQRTKVPGGTILTVIGKGVEFEGKTWYPVVPPAGDFRYVPKTALTIERAANTSFTVRDSLPPDANPPAGSVVPASGTGGARPAPDLPPGPGAAAGKPAVQHPLWAQAEAAEREGRFADAEDLFFRLARAMNEPGGDHDVANLCYTRIHSLREKRRIGLGVPGGTTVATSVATGQRAGSLGPPTRPAGEPKPAPAAGGEGRDDRGKWTGPGKLVRSALALDGRRTYAFETSPGVTVLYVVGGPGVDLERFVNKKVDVYGVSATRRDLQRPFVVATAAELVQ